MQYYNESKKTVVHYLKKAVQ